MGLLKSAFDKIMKLKIITNRSTGAADVIAVEHENGEYLSTAFYVKFSTEDLENLSTNSVKLFINGEERKIKIRIAKKTGYVFFETNLEETINQNIIINKLLENDKFKNVIYEDVEINGSKEEEILKINMEELKRARIENFKIRVFYKKLFHSTFDFYNITHEFEMMHEFLNSAKNIEFLLKKYSGIFNQIILNIKGEQRDCNYFDTTFNGCNRMEMYLSDCMNKKIMQKSIRKIFHENLVEEADDVDNLAVLLIGCQFCRDIMIMPLSLYAKIYQLIQFNFNRKIKNQKFKVSEFFKRHLAKIKNSPYEPEDIYTSQYLSTEDLYALNLRKGINSAQFVLANDKSLTINIFKYDRDDRLIISDVDGTITKSDILGHVYTYMGKDYTHCDIAELFSGIEKNGYKFMYLSSRPITFYDSTKKYIENISQNGHGMPTGPIFLGNYGIFSVLFTEVIMRKPHLMKIAVLLEIKRVFKSNPFFSGFGNKRTDEISYQSVDVPSSLIYIVSSSGAINKEVSKIKMRRYKSIQYFIDALFPKYKSGELKHEYNVDYMSSLYWR